MTYGFKMIRRSISNCVSPGPRSPTLNLYCHRHRNATTLAFQVGPQTLQPGEHVFILLPAPPAFCIGSLGTHGKDIENQGRTVQYLDFEFSFYIAYLLGGSSSKITMPISRSVLFIPDILFNFFQLALADVSHGMRLHPAFR